MFLTNQNAEIVACILLGLKSYVWFQNGQAQIIYFIAYFLFSILIFLISKILLLFCCCTQREFDLKSQVWFQTKIARPQVQLKLY